MPSKRTKRGLDETLAGGDRMDRVASSALARNSWWRPVLHIGIAILIGGSLVVAAFEGDGGEREPSRPAPLFRLSNIRKGAPDVSLRDLRGTPVIVNFWASWCVPCRAELPAFQRVAEALPGVRIVGVDVKDGQRTGRAFADAARVTFPSGWDPQGTVAAAYGARGLPTTAFVDRAGRLVDVHLGEMSERQLRSQISRRFPELDR